MKAASILLLPLVLGGAAAPSPGVTAGHGRAGAVRHRNCAPVVQMINDRAGASRRASPSVLRQGERQAMMIAAVDTHVDGCAVLVLADGSGEVRAAPEPAGERARFMPAR